MVLGTPLGRLICALQALGSSSTEGSILWLLSDCEEGSHVHCLPVLLCLDKNSKVNAIIMFCIGGAILLAMLVLMAVVICLYYKVANTLK